MTMQTINDYADEHQLSIKAALEHAHDAALVIGKHADPTEGARPDLSLNDALVVAASDPSLLYVSAGVRIARTRDATLVAGARALEPGDEPIGLANGAGYYPED